MGAALVVAASAHRPGSGDHKGSSEHDPG